MVRGLLGLLIGLTVGACNANAEFKCTSSDECVSSGPQGICQPNGYCSFPTLACVSGQQYGSQSGPLSGTCVPMDAVGGGSEDTTAAPPGDSGDDGTTNGSDAGTGGGGPGSTTGMGAEGPGSTSGATQSSTGAVASTGSPEESGSSSGDDGGDPVQYQNCSPPCDTSCLMSMNGYQVCRIDCAEMACPTVEYLGDEYDTTCMPVFDTCVIECSQANPSCPPGLSCIISPQLGTCSFPAP